MNTPAHLIMGAAAFGHPDQNRRTWAALAGGFAPDLSLYLMTGVSIYVFGIPARRVFGELYYSQTWQQIFGIDNSFVLWGIALAIAFWLKSAVGIAFAGAGLLHLAFDFPLHNHDARMHFWPLSDWKFISPISYWESARGGDIVGYVEIAIVATLLAVLVRRFADIWLRLAFFVIGLAQIAPFFIWRVMF